MSKLGGSVCAAKNCKNKHYNCKKRFFCFPNDPVRARKWAINSHREDLLENIGRLNRSYKLCSDHFIPEKFTNRFHNRLKYDAIPTLFPVQEDPSKSMAFDHTYCLSKLVNIEDETVPPKKISILENLLLNSEHDKETDPTEGSIDELTMQETNPLSLPDDANIDEGDVNFNDEEDVNISDKDMNFSDEEDSNPSLSPIFLMASTQTSPKLLFNIPRMRKYRETIKMLQIENRDLKKTVKKLENKLQMLQKNIEKR